MASNRLPSVGSDNGTWGYLLNSFLSYALVATTNGSVSAQTGALSYVSSVTGPTYSIGTNGGNTVGNETVLANASTYTISITLPSAITYPGIIHTVKKTDITANTIVISTATTSQTIDGGTIAVLKVQYSSITMASDGTNWYII